MQFEGAVVRRRSFSLALAMIIVLAQAVGLYSIVRFRTQDKRREDSQIAPITWLNLTEPHAPASDNAPMRDAVITPQPPPSNAIALPSVELAAPQAAEQQPFDPLLGALRDLECTALYGDKTAPADRGRCAGVRRTLANVLRPRELEDDPKARKFAREKVAQESPITVPCFGAGGVSLPCLISCAVSGDFEMSTYADGPTPGAQSPPQRGMTGIPDISGGLH